MSQLAALVWLKWRLFRNAMRSRKAAVNSVAATLGTLVVLAFSLLVAFSLGFVTYMIMPWEGATVAVAGKAATVKFVFLLGIFGFMYLMWGIMPLGIGGGSRFDPGHMLLYPISLRRLFAVDLLSELTTLSSIIAVPSIVAVSLAAAWSQGRPGAGLPLALAALVFGISFAKLLSTLVGSLTRRRRTRGETLLALVGLLLAFSGIIIGQLAPIVERHAEWLVHLNWTPPGALAVALTRGLQTGGEGVYALSLVTLVAYVVVLLSATYWIARREALGAGGGGARRASGKARETGVAGGDAGWELPFLPDKLSAIVEKELRYAMRNAPLRMMALMPLILLGIRMFRSTGAGGGGGLEREAATFAALIARYGEGLPAAGGVLYVFMILCSISCNQFAFEEGGMRTFILAPVERRTILLGKNIAGACIAFLLSALLLAANQLVFRDLSTLALVFAALSFVIFAALFSIVGNWLSMHFPKRMQFGKRLNASGMTGLLLIPIVLGVMVMPLASVAVGYFARSLLVEYATLALFAAAALALYALLINRQGRTLARRERDILETVGRQTE